MMFSILCACLAYISFVDPILAREVSKEVSKPVTGDIHMAALLPIADRSRQFSLAKLRPAADIALQLLDDVTALEYSQRTSSASATGYVARARMSRGEGGGFLAGRRLRIDYRDSNCSEVRLFI